MVIALFAFLADNGRVHTSVAPAHGELIPVWATAEQPAPEELETLVAANYKPLKKQSTKVSRVVRATAYNAVPEQTDSTPEICAWGDRIKPGIIAISRDLERIGLTRGKVVHIEGIGKRVVMDRMHHRKRNQIDLYMENYEDAVRFGVKELTISWTEEPSTEQES
jgi:3D (Asp-Asp-Asp) domain-containing protein